MVRYKINMRVCIQNYLEKNNNIIYTIVYIYIRLQFENNKIKRNYVNKKIVYAHRYN